MADTEFESPEFLALLCQGDEGAYRRLIRRFHGSLVGVAGAIIGSRAQAEEVVQDAWLAVFASIARFEGRSTLAAWIFTIVLNCARSRARAEGRLVALPEGLAGGERGVPEGEFLPDGHWREAPALWDVLDPERVVGGRQLWDHVQRAIAGLPAGQRAVIVLRDMEGASAEEACTLLSLSPENQRVLLHRARNRVRRLVDALLGAPRQPGISGAARKAGQALTSLLFFCALRFACRLRPALFQRHFSAVAPGRVCYSPAPEPAGGVNRQRWRLVHYRPGQGQGAR